MVVGGETGGIGSKAIATRDPPIDGFIAGTTRQTGTNLALTANESLLLEREKEGL